ncbi:MAG TPA: hypothetical protein VFT45_25680, partial [Longimicrobium sp.]|nr:hypothetical protein [Longimicrobium sp.]
RPPFAFADSPKVATPRLQRRMVSQREGERADGNRVSWTSVDAAARASSIRVRTAAARSRNYSCRFL